MYDYQQNYSQQAAEREKAVYEKMVAQYNALLSAADEGVFEVTVRCQSGPITIAVSLNHGHQLTHELIEGFSKRIDTLERNLNSTVEEIGLETKSKTSKKAREEAAREAVIQQNKVTFAAMAQQVAVPQQQPARRKPRTIGQSAAQVPMNSSGGSTAHAVSRATNLPGNA